MMISFRLFEISKDSNYNQLKKEFSKFGKLSNLSVKPDNKNLNIQFGYIDFEILENKNGFFAKCNELKIKPSEVKNTPNVSQQYAPQPHQSTTKASMIANPSFHFYKDISYGKGIENFTLMENFKEFFEINGAQAFNLTTIYPGLLVGSGYSHPKLKEKTDDFQLGFFFDHTTGLPIISGSSIKGLIRSVFPKENDKYYKEKIKFLEQEYNFYFTDDSIQNIFNNNAKIVFYDAHILFTKNENNKIFGSDYITSHFSNQEDGMFKEPNPIKFLKILPNVTFKFQFKAPKEYVDLFKAIILDFGLGAKTNVGYGKFQEA